MMKLTWTFYPKGQTQSISLTVIYRPELDAHQLPTGGFLVVDTNTAYVDWTTYKRFDMTDVASRQDAFRRLIPIPNDEDLGGVTIKLLNIPTAS